MAYNADYPSNKEFRLMFLSFCKNDVPSTASMIIHHFEQKKKLFGDGSILGRDVLQSDLNEMDMEVLESGAFQVLPERDSSGRLMFFISSHLMEKMPKDCLAENECRAIWYLQMTLLRDEETKNRSALEVFMNFNGHKLPLDSFLGHSYIYAAIPMETMGCHFCYNDPKLKPYLAGFQVFLSSYFRQRVRIHFGTREEVGFSLQTYGIPTDAFPVSHDGTFSNEEHREWVSMLRSQESATAKESSHHIAVPHRFDVLFGKQTHAREHTGTRRALHIVEMHYEEYEKRSKFEKSIVTDKIISIINVSGGRFLKQGENKEWIEASDDEARKKISHWFRHARSKKRAKIEVDPLQSSPQKLTVNEATPSEQLCAIKRAAANPSPNDKICETTTQTLHFVTDSLHTTKQPLRSV